MHPFRAVSFLLFLMIAMRPSANSQLRNMSEYSQDRINLDKTYFVLHDNGAAEFVWASEWTHDTANAYDGKSAIFVWHFADGSKAYSQQGEGIGMIGRNAGFLLTDKASSLEDIHRNKIQPLTRSNFPVKVELWIGEIAEATGYKPENQGDEACLDASSIEYNKPYHFSDCKSD